MKHHASHVLGAIMILMVLHSCREKESEDNLNEPLTEIEYFDIDWDSPNFKYNDDTGILTISGDSTPPQVNSSFVYLDSKNNPIRVVRSIKKADDCYVVTTAGGTLEDLFINTRFTLTTVPENQTRTIFGEEEIIIRPSLNKTTLTNTKANSYDNELPSITISKQHLPDIPSSISIDDFLMELGLTFSLTFDFGEQEIKGVKKGRINYLKVRLFPSFNLTTVHKNLSKVRYSPTLPLGYFGWPFNVGLIPVYLSIEPGLSLTLSVEGGVDEIQTQSSFDAQLNGSVGFDWDKNEGISYTPMLDRSFVYDLKCSNPQMSSFTQTFWGNVNVPFRLYNRLSFSVGFGPASVTENSSMINEEGYSCWSRIDTHDYRLGLGLGLEIIGGISYSLWDSDPMIWGTPDTLAVYPAKMSLVSLSSNTLDQEEIASVRIKVEGKKKDSAPIAVEGALVQFVTKNGKVSSEYCNSDTEGIVTAGFSLKDPTEKGCLSALLIDGKGKVIAEINDIEFTPKTSSDDNDDEYIPTADDYIIRYKRFKSGNEIQDERNRIDRFDEGNVVCGLTVISHDEDYKSDPNFILGTITLDGPVISVPEREFSLSRISSISLPLSCEEIGKFAFFMSEITGITTVPDRIRSIGDFCFYESKLNGVNLGKSVEKIGSQAFMGLEFTSIPIFPEKLREIGLAAFMDNSMSGELKLPSGLRVIGASAFAGCKNITGSVRIPYGVQELGLGIFSKCEKLDFIYVPSKWVADRDPLDDSFETLILGIDRDGCAATVVYY